MTLPDKARLEKLLGMLGSSFDGERANAASMIQKLAEKNKMTINEMVAKVMAGPAAPPPPPPQPTWSNVNPKRHANPGAMMGNDLLFGLEAALDTEALTDWERQFATDVSGRYERDYELSPKQITIVERIILKASRWRSF